MFALIFISFHEVFVQEKKSISDFPGLKRALNNLTRRIDTSRRATAADERRKNINTIKGLISGFFTNTDPSKMIYSDHNSLDIDDYIRRSGIELANFELKQGLLPLKEPREVNRDLLDRILATICAIANNGPNRVGRVIIGVADKASDATRITEIDQIQPRTVADKFVVGIQREADALGISLEEYHGILRSCIERSALSNPLKDSVLSAIDFNSYFGLGVIIITVPEQREPAYFGDEIYWRDGDNTKVAVGAKQIAEISRRF